MFSNREKITWYDKMG